MATKLEDSNIANYGSQDMTDAKLAAARSAEEWKGCGQLGSMKQKVEVWRVEKLHVKKWPKNRYGEFYSGDSYIVLHSYRNEDETSTEYNLFFWLGKNTSIDERGVAAYKTVELDDLFGDKPVQYRECQGHESHKFLALFGSVTYLDGGIESGFNHTKPEEYAPRLMQFKCAGKHVRMSEVKKELASLNQGDVFLLDMGLELIQWNGPAAKATERRKAMNQILQIKEDRNGRPKSRVLDGDEDDDVFWAQLGGKGAVSAAIPDTDVKKRPKKLTRVSDASGTLESTLVATGELKRSMLSSNDVFILDHGIVLYVYIGTNASRTEKAKAFPTAISYLAAEGLPNHTPVTRVIEGGEPSGFIKCFHS